MERNEGSLDRGLRITAGVALIGAAVSGLLGPWAYVGVVPLATGLLGWCPLYTVLGIKTCKVR